MPVPTEFCELEGLGVVNIRAIFGRRSESDVSYTQMNCHE